MENDAELLCLGTTANQYKRKTPPSPAEHHISSDAPILGISNPSLSKRNRRDISAPVTFGKSHNFESGTSDTIHSPRASSRKEKDVTIRNEHSPRPLPMRSSARIAQRLASATEKSDAVNSDYNNSASRSIAISPNPASASQNAALDPRPFPSGASHRSVDEIDNSYVSASRQVDKFTSVISTKNSPTSGVPGTTKSPTSATSPAPKSLTKRSLLEPLTSANSEREARGPTSTAVQLSTTSGTTLQPVVEHSSRAVSFSRVHEWTESHTPPQTPCTRLGTLSIFLPDRARSVSVPTLPAPRSPPPSYESTVIAPFRTLSSDDSRPRASSDVHLSMLSSVPTPPIETTHPDGLPLDLLRSVISTLTSAQLASWRSFVMHRNAQRSLLASRTAQVQLALQRLSSFVPRVLVHVGTTENRNIMVRLQGMNIPAIVQMRDLGNSGLKPLGFDKKSATLVLHARTSLVSSVIEAQMSLPMIDRTSPDEYSQSGEAAEEYLGTQVESENGANQVPERECRD
jgi:hypothetical protein